MNLQYSSRIDKLQQFGIELTGHTQPIFGVDMEYATGSVVARDDRTICGNPKNWGMGYAGNGYTTADIAEIADSMQPLQHGHNYRTSTIDISEGRYNLPGGFDHACPVKSDYADYNGATSLNDPWQLSPDLQNVFGQRGWQLDQHGRPCHPLTDTLITKLGAQFGLGPNHLYYGDNPLVICRVTDSEGKVLISRGNHHQKLPEVQIAPDMYKITARGWLAGNRPNTVTGLKAAATQLLASLGIKQDLRTSNIVRAERPFRPGDTLNSWTTAYTILITLLTTGKEIDDSHLWISPNGINRIARHMPPLYKRALLA